jgi:hypothetical protein
LHEADYCWPAAAAAAAPPAAPPAAQVSAGALCLKLLLHCFATCRFKVQYNYHTLLLLVLAGCPPAVHAVVLCCAQAPSNARHKQTLHHRHSGHSNQGTMFHKRAQEYAAAAAAAAVLRCRCSLLFLLFLLQQLLRCCCCPCSFLSLLLWRVQLDEVVDAQDGQRSLGGKLQ